MFKKLIAFLLVISGSAQACVGRYMDKNGYMHITADGSDGHYDHIVIDDGSNDIYHPIVRAHNSDVQHFKIATPAEHIEHTIRELKQVIESVHHLQLKEEIKHRVIKNTEEAIKDLESNAPMLMPTVGSMQYTTTIDKYGCKHQIGHNGSAYTFDTVIGCPTKELCEQFNCGKTQTIAPAWKYPVNPLIPLQAEFFTRLDENGCKYLVQKDAGKFFETMVGCKKPELCNGKCGKKYEISYEQFKKLYEPHVNTDPHYPPVPLAPIIPHSLMK